MSLIYDADPIGWMLVFSIHDRRIDQAVVDKVFHCSFRLIQLQARHWWSVPCGSRRRLQEIVQRSGLGLESSGSRDGWTALLLRCGQGQTSDHGTLPGQSHHAFHQQFGSRKSQPRPIIPVDLYHWRCHLIRGLLRLKGWPKRVL